MSEPASRAVIDAANVYEALFVPALFGPWAPRVADAARIAPGQRVLDVACGTGVLAREVAARVGPSGSVVGVDPNPGMLAVAERLAPEVAWRAGEAEALPFPDESFDAVVSQFGLMFFADRGVALREMLRVTVRGGRLAVAVLDALEHAPAYAAEVELLAEFAGTPAADALRAPFALGERERLATLFAEAGAASVAIETRLGQGRFPSIRTMVEADLLGWMPAVGVVLTEEVVERTLQEAERALAPWVTADGAVEFDLPAHIVTATRA